MAAISFSENHDHAWVVAGWAFRQILEDILLHYPDSQNIEKEFEEARALKSLILYKMEPRLRDQIAAAIEQVAVGILDGSASSGLSEKPYGNSQSVEEYRKGLSDLVRTIRLWKSG